MCLQHANLWNRYALRQSTLRRRARIFLILYAVCSNQCETRHNLIVLFVFHVRKEIQLWSTIRAKLSALKEVQSHAEDSISTIERLQQQWQSLGTSSDGEHDAINDDVDDEKDDQRNEVAEMLEKAYAKLSKDTDDEKRYFRALLGHDLSNQAVQRIDSPVQHRCRCSRITRNPGGPSDP